MKFDKDTEIKIRDYCADYENHKEQIDKALEELPENQRKTILNDVINRRGYYRSDLAGYISEPEYRYNKQIFKNALLSLMK